MLGWFKKKFKKQEPVAPVVDTPPAAPEPVDKTEAPVEKSPPVVKEHVPGTAVLPEAAPVAEVEEKVEAVPAAKIMKQVPEQKPETLVQPEPDQEKKPAPAPPPPPEEKPLKIRKESEIDKEPVKKKRTLFARLTERLGKTRETFTYQLDALFLGKKEIDGEMLDDLEEILIAADLGVGTTQDLLETARRKVKRKEMYDPKSLKETLKVQIRKLIADNDQDAALVMPDKGPFVIMVIGVNGVGKTTTIGKIARKFQQAGNSVLLVAGDTFRAAAVSQLKIWGERSNVPVVAHKEGADPSSVVFDALGIAQAQNIDVVLVDTAGRMHTKDNLMEELKKIKRVMGKKLKGAPHEVMLVIDATTGQNGISQARLFDDAVGVTGITLTKLDGTSKGGIVANICKELKIPIRFIGIGEKTADLRDFDAGEFVDALFHSGTNQSE
ncbi:signal recognition particle-docking protein FtsY [Desulfopila sp. IMCC35006]|uniref:signal recognition particle-docking protein FtsY n=1 Tax=Desulfopila sp. IMCC35006 TaxID=2569542 RepID=UPI0010AB71CF|nr:signal recognition particle-docking protein FtsY [Desulfopila sp. IMCC35006]TKB26523.1 signal recognition particle-docking protein FtsY [Desulfopila sp. IMCC35006]